MKVFRYTFGVILLTTVFLVSACNLPNSLPATATLTAEDPNAVFTQVAMTVIAEMTLNAPTATETPTEDSVSASSGAEVGDGVEAQPSPTEDLPTDTPIPSITAEEDGEPMISASINTNCRYGPDPYWEIEGYLLVGEESVVHGKSPNSYWWYIENPSLAGDFCWVWSETTTVTGDLDGIKVVQPPSTPTPTPTNTLTPTPTETVDVYP